MPEFHFFADRNDARVVLTAELGRFGVDKNLIFAMDQMVQLGQADVFISDNDDEQVMLRLYDPKSGVPRYVLVLEAGLKGGVDGSQYGLQ
jgi:hypothetical protein